MDQIDRNQTTPGMANYPPSYYASTINRAGYYPSLVNSENVDIAVIGAGFSGISTAMELAKQGFSVRLIEKSLIGFGASGRNGGQVTPGYGPGISKLIKILNKPDIKRVWNYSVDAVALVKSRIDSYKIACDLRPGVIAAALNPKHMAGLEYDHECLLRLCDEHHSLLWDQKRLRQSIETPRYIGAAQDTRSFSINPLKYCLGLAAAAVSHGVKIAERTAVENITSGKISAPSKSRNFFAHQESLTPPYHLHCRSLSPENIGTESIVTAQYVVLATDAYDLGLVPHLKGMIMNVPSVIIATEAIPDFIDKYYPGGEAVADCNHVLDYFRPSPDGRILFGGRAFYNGSAPNDFMNALRPRLTKVFPELAKVGLEFGWSGLVGISPHRLPHIGRAAPNFYYATGYSGQGIALANYAGLVIANDIGGKSEPFSEMELWPKTKFFGRGNLDPVLKLFGMLWFMLLDTKQQK